MHNSQWHSPNEHHEWTIHFQRKLKCQGYIYIAHRLWHDSTSLPPSLSVCVNVSRKQLIFSISKPLIKKYAWLSSITLFYQCLSLRFDTMKIPFQFYNTPSSKLFSPPTQNAYGIMDAFLFLHRRALSLSLSCYLCLYVP